MISLVAKLKSTYRILRQIGFKTSVSNQISNLLFKETFRPLNSKYVSYQLTHSPIPEHLIFHFLSKCNLKSNDIIFIPTNLIKKASSRFNGSFFDTLNFPNSFDSFGRLIWATERCDKEARVASYFYKTDKEVLVLQHIGPAKSWMHDQDKECVLREEYNQQKSEGLSFFPLEGDFANILQIIDHTKDLEGDFIEIGCYQGSASCVIASYMNSQKINKNYIIYDYFESFNYEELDNSKDSFFKNIDLSMPEDAVNIVSNRVNSRLDKKDLVKVIKRNIIEKDALKEVSKIAFANLDVDVYPAIYSGLMHIHKKLVVGGVIIIEDAGHTPFLLGATVALNDFLNEVGRKNYFKIHLDSGQYVLLRLSEN